MRSWVLRHRALSAIIAVCVALIVVAIVAGPSHPVTRSDASSVQSPPVIAPSSTRASTSPASPSRTFPPTTFQQINADGQRPATYTQIDTSPIGTGTCTGDRVVITVPRSATSRAIETALADAYVQHDMASQGTAVVFAYYNAKDNGRLPYTAGRLQVDSPCDGVTPRTIEIDIGNALGNYRTYKVTS